MTVITQPAIMPIVVELPVLPLTPPIEALVAVVKLLDITDDKIVDIIITCTKVLDSTDVKMVDTADVEVVAITGVEVGTITGDITDMAT